MEKTDQQCKSSNKENMLTAVRFWALERGFDETENVSNADLTFKKGDFKIAFITEFDKSKIQLKYNLADIKRNKGDFIYVVTDDNGKRRELVKNIPDHCGILCYANPFGLGYLYQVLKEPDLII